MKKITTIKLNPLLNIKGVENGNELFFVLSSLFIISCVYFYRFGNYIFFYQENQFLFIFSNEYLQKFVIRPGGLLEYAGIFLSQGYFNYFYASVILSAIFILTAFVYLEINKKLSSDGTYSIPLIIVPSCLLILFQSNINWLIHHNLGILLTGLYFWLSIVSDKKSTRILALAFFPLFFYFAGGYAWIYFLMYAVYNILYDKWIYPVVLLAIASATFILFKEVIFLQPVLLLLFYHLPATEYFRHPEVIYILAITIIIYPVLIKLIYSIKVKKGITLFISKYSALIILALTVIPLSLNYNRPLVNLFKLEKFIIRQDWDKVIEYQEAVRLNNIIAQYYYNLALSEKGQLCDRMFFGPQNFGPNSLLKPWDSKEGINSLFRGVYFFYTIGLINEAHRWAFESMVVQGYRPENIKMLIKTDLINGNFRVAEKYLDVLKKTLHYRKWAKKYEEMLFKPELVKSDPELGEKIKLQPKGDFQIRIKNPQANVLLLLKTNPDNKKAFEYKIAWYLLEKNVGVAVNEIKQLKEIGYTRIPRYLEEAAMAFSVNVGTVPDLGGLKISKETEKRYNDYESALAIFNGNQALGGKVVRNAGKNSYWLYLDFK